MLAVAIAVGAVAGVAAPAGAVTVEARNGTVGPVTLNGPMLTMQDTRIPSFPYTQIRLYSSAGFTVRRSAAYAGAQRVVATYTVQQWNSTGYWQNYFSSQPYSGTVSGTGTLNFPAWSGNASSEPTFTNYYRVVVTIAWKNAATGANLGAEVLAPSLRSETVCSTRFYACTQYAGFVLV